MRSDPTVTPPTFRKVAFFIVLTSALAYCLPTRVPPERVVSMLWGYSENTGKSLRVVPSPCKHRPGTLGHSHPPHTIEKRYALRSDQWAITYHVGAQSVFHSPDLEVIPPLGDAQYFRLSQARRADHPLGLAQHQSPKVEKVTYIIIIR